MLVRTSGTSTATTTENQLSADTQAVSAQQDSSGDESVTEASSSVEEGETNAIPLDTEASLGDEPNSDPQESESESVVGPDGAEPAIVLPPEPAAESESMSALETKTTE